jgi:hypothetical protein
VPLHGLGERLRGRPGHRWRGRRHPRQRTVVVAGQLFADNPSLHPLRHHVRRAGGQAELPQIVVGRLLHRQHSPHQSAELDGVVHVGGDDRLRRPGPDHPGELERALLVPPTVAAVLQHQVEPEALPAPKLGNGRERGERVDLERGESPRPHYLLHRVGDRYDAEVELQRFERREPGGELTEELNGLVGMRSNQRLPRARVRDADGEVQAGRDPAEGHLTGDAHRLVAQSNIQSHQRGSARRSGQRRRHRGLSAQYFNNQ